jgi:hypothetical protein
VVDRVLEQIGQVEFQTFPSDAPALLEHVTDRGELSVLRVLGGCAAESQPTLLPALGASGAGPLRPRLRPSAQPLTDDAESDGPRRRWPGRQPRQVWWRMKS